MELKFRSRQPEAARPQPGKKGEGYRLKQSKHKRGPASP
jgi:hypothetical protein